MKIRNAENKRNYTIRLPQKDVDKLLEMTGLNFTDSVGALIKSFNEGQPINIIAVGDGIYQMTHKQIVEKEGNILDKLV